MVITNSNTRRTLIVLPETDELKQPNDRHAQIDMKVFNVIERDDVWTFFLLCAYDGFEMLVATNCFGWKWMAADGCRWQHDWNEDFIWLTSWWRRYVLMAEDTSRCRFQKKIHKMTIRPFGSIVFLCIFSLVVTVTFFCSWRHCCYNTYWRQDTETHIFVVISL